MFKLDFSTWCTSAVIGSMLALFPTVFIVDGLDMIGFNVYTGFYSQLVSMVCGSFGGAYAFHRVVIRGNKW